MGWHKNDAGKKNLKKMQDFSKEIIRNIEWVHRATPAYTNPSATSAPPHLVAKITNWDMSEKIKSAIFNTNQEGKSAVFISQMYLKSLTEGNATFKYQADLKEQEPSIQDVFKVSDRRKCRF